MALKSIFYTRTGISPLPPRRRLYLSGSNSSLHPARINPFETELCAPLLALGKLHSVPPREICDPEFRRRYLRNFADGVWIFSDSLDCVESL